MKKRLYDMARVLRSKNSGPFSITLDVLFDDEKSYLVVKNSGAITEKSIAALYGINASQVTVLAYYDKAMGVKITFNRVFSSGSSFDTDGYGAQYHAPLMELEIES